MNSNSLINHNGDFCTGCGQGFMRNLIGFDTLPLVEFVPAPHLTHKKVLECLRMDPPEDAAANFTGMKKGQARHQDGWQENGTHADE